MKRKTFLLRIEETDLNELRGVAKQADRKQSEIARDGVNKEVQRIKQELSKQVKESA